MDVSIDTCTTCNVCDCRDDYQEEAYYKDRIEYLELLVKKYKFDSLTGLMGKLDCMETSIRLFEEYKFSGMPFYFALIDINGLHNINRTQGYFAGDKVIRDIATGLLKQFQLHQVYRISGDEFVVLIRSYHYSKKEIESKLGSIPGITFVVDECINGYITPKQMFKKLDVKLCEKKCLSSEKRI